MMHKGWLYTALCRNSRPSSYPFREPKPKAFHLARIIRGPYSRIMRARQGGYAFFLAETARIRMIRSDCFG